MFQLTQLRPTFGHWTYHFKEKSYPAAQVFDITEYEGIVYVRGDSILRQLGQSDMHLGLDILATETTTHRVEMVHMAVEISIFHSGRSCSK